MPNQVIKKALKKFFFLIAQAHSAGQICFPATFTHFNDSEIAFKQQQHCNQHVIVN